MEFSSTTCIALTPPQLITKASDQSKIEILLVLTTEMFDFYLTLLQLINFLINLLQFFGYLLPGNIYRPSCQQSGSIYLHLSQPAFAVIASQRASARDKEPRPKSRHRSCIPEFQKFLPILPPLSVQSLPGRRLHPSKG